jgi:carboxyl-terminal processing protease
MIRWLEAPCLLMLLAAAPAPSRDAARNAATFDRAWSIVDRDYWDRSATRAIWSTARDQFRNPALAASGDRDFYRILNAMLDTLHSSHLYARPAGRQAGSRHRLDPDLAAALGFEAYESKGAWRVTAVRSGGPADRAGVATGAELIGIDGRPPADAEEPATGSRVMVALVDDHGRPTRVELVAMAVPEEPDRSVRILPGGIALLRFDGFEPGVDRWLADRLAAPPRAAILDLRYNHGGTAESLVRVAGLFAPGAPILQRGNAGRSTIEYAASTGMGHAGPLAVLVGPYSASAAELFAAFVQDNHLGIVVGDTTAGRVTAGVEHRLPDGGTLMVAEEDVRTGHGTRLEGRGLMPAYPVTVSTADLRAGRDPVLDRAVELLGDR